MSPPAGLLPGSRSGDCSRGCTQGWDVCAFQALLLQVAVGERGWNADGADLSWYPGDCSRGPAAGTAPGAAPRVGMCVPFRPFCYRLLWGREDGTRMGRMGWIFAEDSGLSGHLYC